MSFPPTLTAEEAAALIDHGQTIGFSGFTPAGAAKAIPRALAARAKAEHAAGRPFQVGVLTGASTGPSLDGALAAAEAIGFRTPISRERGHAGDRVGAPGGGILSQPSSDPWSATRP
jgi:acyl-CoA hydrolase